MPKAGKASQIRRITVGTAILLAPLVALAGALLTPQFIGGVESELAFIAEKPNQWLMSNFLNLFGFMFFIPAILGLTQLFRHRAVVLGHLGAGLAMVGLYFHGAVVSYSLVELPLVESGWEHTLAFSGKMYEHIAFTLILMPFLTFFLGLLLISIAIWQSRVAPLWVPGVIVVGLVSNFVAPREVSPEMMFILFLLGFGWLGIKILRMSSIEWEQGQGEQQSSSNVSVKPVTVA